MSPNDTKERGKYRFRWRCDACRESGDWHDNPEDAQAARDGHKATHEGPLVEGTRIQRYPADEVAS